MADKYTRIVPVDQMGFGESDQRRKRHPIRTLIVTLIVLAALFIPGYLVADSLARQYAGQFIQAGIAQKLGVSSTDSVHVSLGKGSILLEVIQRKLKHIHVTVDQFTADAITGSAVLDASTVPLDTSKPTSSVGISVTIGQDSLRRLIASKADSPGATVALVGTRVRVGTKVKLFGASVPIAVDLTPRASGKRIIFTPVSIVVNKKAYSLAALRASPIAGLVSKLIAPRAFCVASSLPNALTLRSVSVSGTNLVIALTGTNVPLDSLSTKGSCAAG
jgi:hypothetical protein